MSTTKVRFVLVSDTHSTSPEDGLFKVPDGDVFIHAGDLTNRGTFAELKKTLGWIERLPHEVKIVIAGNHDLGLDKSFVKTQQTCSNSDSRLSELDMVASLFSPSSLPSNMHYLKHSSLAVTIPSKNTLPIKIFGSPYVPNFDIHRTQNDDATSLVSATAQNNEEPMNEPYDYGRGKESNTKNQKEIPEFGAFTYNPETDAKKLWSDIPSDTHILITHGPAKGRLDDTKVDAKEKTLETKDHGEEKKVAGLVGRSIGCEALGARVKEIKPWLHICGHVHESRGVERVVWPLCSEQRADTLSSSDSPSLLPLTLTSLQPATATTISPESNLSNLCGTILLWQDPGQDLVTSSAIVNNDSKSCKLIKMNNKKQSLVDISSKTRMFNFTPLRKNEETVFINASIMKHSWPHGKERNKAIVVDVDVDMDMDVELNDNLGH